MQEGESLLVRVCDGVDDFGEGCLEGFEFSPC